jgi:hypothetical protein
VQAAVIIDMFSYKAISYEEHTQVAGLFVHFLLWYIYPCSPKLIVSNMDGKR